MAKKRKRSTQARADKKQSRRVEKDDSYSSDPQEPPTVAVANSEKEVRPTGKTYSKLRLAAALIVYVAWFAFLLFTAFSLR